MSVTDQLISISPEDPEYFADLLSKIPRTANRRLASDGQSCPDVPGIQGVDVALTQRLQTLLDAVADISLCRRGNVSATMASLKKDNAGTLETQLYIVFNHEDDESARYYPQHLQNILNMLRQVPKPSATDRSPKVIARELQSNYIEICQAIHKYSSEIFHHRVMKRQGKLPQIRGYIEQDQTDHFSDGQRETLLTFLDDVGTIIKATTTATATTEQFSTSYIKLLLGTYTYWTHHGLLPKDSSAENKFTLLDHADIWLTENRKIGFQLRRWAVKIMSFVISANRLFIMTQSPRLFKIIHGNFSIKVLGSATTAPYHCSLSSQTIQAALNTAADEVGQRPNDWDNKCEWFIARVLGQLEEPIDVDHWTPTVHAELAMVIAMANGEIKDVLPYIGVSKASCTMCSHYIGAFNQVWKQNIVTKGSHGKAYPGWSWPSFPDRDEELRQAFLGRVRWQLLSDFELYAQRRLSDSSSVGSGGPEWEELLHREIVQKLANFSAFLSSKAQKLSSWDVVI